MNEEHLVAAATPLIGIVTPLLTQLVRRHLLPWSGIAAYWLCLAVAAVLLGIAYVSNDLTPTWAEFAKGLGGAFTVSQLLYAHLRETLDNKLPAGGGEDAP